MTLASYSVLRRFQSLRRGPAKPLVGLALQRRQVEQCRRPAPHRAGVHVVHRRRPLAGGRHDGVGVRPAVDAPYPGHPSLVVRLARTHVHRVEPRRQVRHHFVVARRCECLDLPVALDHKGQRRRLHPAHAARRAVLDRVGPRQVEAHQPVGLVTRLRRVRQLVEVAPRLEVLKPHPQRLLRQAGHPQPLHRRRAA